MKNKIIVRVEGGLVTDVFSNINDLEVHILDEDVLEGENSDYDEFRIELREEIKELNQQ